MWLCNLKNFSFTIVQPPNLDNSQVSGVHTIKNPEDLREFTSLCLQSCSEIFWGSSTFDPTVHIIVTIFAGQRNIQYLNPATSSEEQENEIKLKAYSGRLYLRVLHGGMLNGILKKMLNLEEIHFSVWFNQYERIFEGLRRLPKLQKLIYTFRNMIN